MSVRPDGHRLQPWDGVYCSLVATLVLCGLPILYSASYAFALSCGFNAAYFAVRQMVFVLVGVVLMVWVSRVPLQRVAYCTVPLLALSFIGLLVVLTNGVTRGGAQRWLDLGPITVQPSELIKLAAVIFLAQVLSRLERRDVEALLSVIVAGVVIGSMVLLLLKEPHLSATILLLAVSLLMLIVAGCPTRWIALLLIVPAVMGAHLYPKLPQYQRARIESWLQSQFDDGEPSYDVKQSHFALGLGGWFGVGFCKGLQKLLFLPAPHNDFILAVIGEEFGLAGTLFTLFLYGLLITRGATIAMQASTPFGGLLAFGFTALFGVEVLIHASVVTGVLPATGMTLPFVSAGGSSMVSHLIAVGCILNVSRTALKGGPQRHESADGRRSIRRTHLSPSLSGSQVAH